MLEIARTSDLQIAVGSQHDVHFLPQTLHQSRFVGSCKAIGGSSRKGLAKKCGLEHLRRLRQNDSLARDCRSDERDIFRQAGPLHFLDGIHRGNAQDRSAARRASAITRSTCSRVTSGRTASCTKINSASARPAPARWPRIPGAYRRRAKLAPAGRGALQRCALSAHSTSSARVAIRNSPIAGQAASRRSVKTTTGTPSSRRNCLGESAPMRVPRPAAGKMATMRGHSSCAPQLVYRSSRARPKVQEFTPHAYPGSQSRKHSLTHALASGLGGIGHD